MQAAMGLTQLPKLPSFVAARRTNAHAFAAALAGREDHLQLQVETQNGHHSWFGFPMTVAADAPFSAQDLRYHLEQVGIETRPIICGNIAMQPGLQANPHRVVGELQHASRVMTHALSVGCHQSIDDQARRYLVDQVFGFLDLWT